MKNKKAKLMSIGLAVVGSMALAGGGQSVFADNPYNILYENGEPLGSENVTFLSLGTGFKELLDPQDATASVGGSGWQVGYTDWSSGSCDKIYYFTVPLDNGTHNISNKSYSTQNDQVKETVNIDSVSFEGIPDYLISENHETAIMTHLQSGSIAIFKKVFGDSTCSTEGLVVPEAYWGSEQGKLQGGKAFIHTTIKLTDPDDETKPFLSDDLYFGITDIDRGQSYKILNAGSQLMKGNMYALDDAQLQPTSQQSPENFRNMFVNNSENYIYSQYNDGDTYHPFDITGRKSSVYAKVANTEEGLGVIFGFGASAASSTRYFHKTYTVEYKSVHGTVNDADKQTGIKSEEVISGGNPAGAEQTPDAHYEFVHWITEQDVSAEIDGQLKEFKKGSEIPEDAINKVIVHDNLVFTAYNKTYTVKYESDQYGKITGTTEENRNSSEHPGGSTQEAYTDYYFVYWICDKDVELIDGTKIKAGEAMTDEQVKQVKITQDLVFTAIHKTKPNTPNTGNFTKDGDNVAPIIGLLVAALASTGFAGYYVYNRKKSVVKLDK